jgi:hypothetical protein
MYFLPRVINHLSPYPFQKSHYSRTNLLISSNFCRRGGNWWRCLLPVVSLARQDAYEILLYKILNYIMKLSRLFSKITKFRKRPIRNFTKFREISAKFPLAKFRVYLRVIRWMIINVQRCTAPSYTFRHVDEQFFFEVGDSATWYSIHTCSMLRGSTLKKMFP